MPEWTAPNLDYAKCQKCGGCGQIASDDDQSPWAVWEALPPGSDIAVRLGWVVPLPCPECGPIAGGRDA